MDSGMEAVNKNYSNTETEPEFDNTNELSESGIFGSETVDTNHSTSGIEDNFNNANELSESGILGSESMDTNDSNTRTEFSFANTDELSEAGASGIEGQDDPIDDGANQNNLLVDNERNSESIYKGGHIPYFGPRKRDSKMTFYFENSFGINQENGAKIMDDYLKRWDSQNFFLIKNPNIYPRYMPIEPLAQQIENDIALSPQPNTLYNMYQLRFGEVLSHECMSSEQDKHERRLSNFIKLNEEQKEFVTFIRDNIMCMSELNEPSTKSILLEGQTGTGKTSTLECIRDIGNSNVLYITFTNRLCADVSSKFHLKTITLHKFLMSVLNKKSDFVIKLVNEMKVSQSATEIIEKMLVDITRNSFDNIFPTQEIVNHESNKNSQTNYQTKCVNTVFLDEISMFSPVQLECFIEILNVASTLSRKKFIIILAGDFMLIPPLLSKLNDYQRIFNSCEFKREFRQQMRIIDENYLNILKTIKIVDSFTFIAELKSVISPTCISQKIQYVYPLEIINRAYSTLQTTKCYLWLKEFGDDFFSSILPITAFVFTNVEMHYMNLSLAFSIYSQLREKDPSFIQNFICFSKFKTEKLKNSSIFPVLPLIRFFPYRLLVKSRYIPHKCIVYLIKWSFEDENVVVYCPDNKKFFFVRFCSFNINLSESYATGIPLELAFCKTFHSSQGLNFSEEIIVPLDDIDCHELYTVLTRVRSGNQLKNIYSMYIKIESVDE